MSKMYLVNNRVSESPVYWTAIYNDGTVVNQIDECGKICEKWSTLSIENLEYWGVVSNLGSYGFYLKDSICDMNGTKLRFTPSTSGKLSYSRTILSSSDGWLGTKGVQIGFGGHVLKLIFLPEPKVVFSMQQEITGNGVKDFELKTSD